MASNIDMSLDDFVTLKKKKGGNKGNNKGAGKPFKGKPAGVKKLQGVKQQTTDLRKVISGKQKGGITDLRAKLKPKALYTSKFVTKHTSKSNPTTPTITPKGIKTRTMKSRLKSEDIPKLRSRKSDPGPLLSRRPVSPKLPSYEEAKKITVTVPGSLQPTTSSTEVSVRSSWPASPGAFFMQCGFLISFSL